MDATGQRPDVVSAFENDDGFGERFAARQQPQFTGDSWEEFSPPKSFRRSSVNGSPAQPGYNGAVEGQRRWMPWLARRRSGAAADWRGSLKSNDVTLDAATRKLKELIARRRLAKMWLTEVRVAKFTPN